MVLQIHDNLLVSDLQQRFSKYFQYLKIEFYSNPHRSYEGSEEKYIISPGKRIGEIREIHLEGGLEIKSFYTVDRVERDFKEKFDLNVQVFRNENGGWIQTSKTDKYTLLQQAEMVYNAHTSIFPIFQDQLGEYNYL